jgi:hypothetical protein
MRQVLLTLPNDDQTGSNSVGANGPQVIGTERLPLEIMRAQRGAAAVALRAMVLQGLVEGRK